MNNEYRRTTASTPPSGNGGDKAALLLAALWIGKTVIEIGTGIPLPDVEA